MYPTSPLRDDTRRLQYAGQFRGQKGLSPLELSHYEFGPLKKINLPDYPNQRYIISY
jgi:hypothetical protein